jgi:hypothetical protein
LAPVEVGSHLSVIGSYRPPLFKLPLAVEDQPPQTIISRPVHTAVWKYRAAGTPAPLDVGVQLSVAGM